MQRRRSGPAWGVAGIYVRVEVERRTWAAAGVDAGVGAQVQGVAVADLFLDRGLPIVSLRGRTADITRRYVDGSPQRWPGLPIAILVDSNTASAAEIVAGALQDEHRAVIIGGRTYGKGSAQSIFPLPDGSAVRLTTARWFTPSGRSIDSSGIAPDIRLASTRGDSALLPAVTLLRGVRTPAELQQRVPRTISAAGREP